MHATGSGLTDIGRKRGSNEDRLLVENDLGLYVVCDGMGGHAAGEVASDTALAALERAVRDDRAQVHRVRNGRLPAKKLESLLATALRGACREVYQLAVSKPDLAGMGCALTALLIAGSKAVMAHVGDTRLYLGRGGTLHQLSTDHTMIEELVQSGMIPRESAHQHPFGGILTRAIGTQESVRVDTLVFDVLAGDRYLLCSDGLSNYVRDLDELAVQVGSGDVESVPEELIDFANEAGGRDNITAVLVGIEIDPDERPLALALTAEAQVKLEALGSVFLFEDLTLAQLTRVLSSSRTDTFAAGDSILKEGEPCGQLLVVVEGRFAVERGGKILAELDSGDHVGETTLLRPRPSRAGIRALDDGRLLILGGAEFRALAKSRPWLGVALLEKLGRRLSLAADREPVSEHGEESAAGPALDEIF